MNTQENNKQIAEFMQKGSEGFGLYDYNCKHYKLYELKFHEDWNWLMPVIQKCLIGEAEHSEDVSNLAIKNIYEGICNQDISLAYESVLKFINQHKNK